MVLQREIGRGTTDSNGRIVIPYMGIGAGKLQLKAEATINSSRFVSEIYGVIDALLFDPCTSVIAGRWHNYQSILSITYNENGMTITKDEQNNTQRYLYYNDSSISTTKIGGYNTITTPIEMLFTVEAITGSIQLVIVDNNSNQRFIEITKTGKYKLTFDGSTLVVKLNDTQMGNSYVVDGSNFQFRLGFNAQGESITFKDFTIYPI